jgi:23S rRNA pseudouridine2605 synthase
VEVRLQKVLSAAGLGSRRKCEEFISAGRVTVDGVVTDELGSRVDPDTAVIRVDGVRIAQAQGHVVYALNKPRGVVTAMSDDRAECVGDLVAHMDVRLFHVGRLDADTEGLLLLTNDGELAQRLGHPSHGIVKTYVVKVRGRVDRALARQVLAGVDVEGRDVAVTDCTVTDTADAASVVRLSIHEGRNRIIRRMFEQLGHPVIDLVRVQVGPVSLGALRSGQLRQLSREELGRLYEAAGL